MLTFVFALFIMLGMCVGILGFITWAIRQWTVAQKYRYLIRLHQAMPPAPVTSNVVTGSRWSITYKERGKSKTVIVSGSSEGEAMKNFVATTSVGYGHIVSSVKL